MAKTSLFLTGLTAGLISLGALAEPGPGSGLEGMGGMNGMAPGMAGGPRQAAEINCSKAKNPAQCEARQKARAQCQGKTGTDLRACVDDHLPPPDCSKANNPQRCEAQQKARAACKGKYGPERSQCMRDQARPVAKPSAPAPAPKKKS